MIQCKDASQAMWETQSLTLLTRSVNIVMLELMTRSSCQTFFEQNVMGMTVYVMSCWFFSCLVIHSC